jgi:hypothetical protein
MIPPAMGVQVDYFQAVVTEYVRANRSLFVNPEYFLPLDPGVKQPTKGRSWYVDLVAVSFKAKTVFLCEITYAQTPASLTERLASWRPMWTAIVEAIKRDTRVPIDWHVRPWLFLPESKIEKFLGKMGTFPAVPLITPLEMTMPWKYSNFDLIEEGPKPECIPVEMQT